MRLSRHLVVLIAVAMVPIALVASVFAAVIARQERAQVEQAVVSAARTLAVAFDRELEGIIGGLETIARLKALDEGDFDSFHDRAKRIAEARQEWTALALVDASGKKILDTAQPSAAALPGGGPDPLALDALRTGKPAIAASPAEDGRSGEETLPIALPVYRGGQIQYAIWVAYRLPMLNRAFDQVRIPAQWTVTVVSPAGSLIARPGTLAESIGQATAARLDLIAPTEDAATQWASTNGGGSIFAAVSRVPRAQWSVVVGIPEREYWAPVWRAAALAGGGGTVAIALSMLCAFGVARRISRSIGATARAAAAVSRGEAPGLDAPGSIAEVRELSDSLNDIAATVARGRVERDAAIAEMETRARYRDALARIYLLGWDEADIGVLLTKITEQLGSFFGAQACVVFRLDEGSLRVLAATGWPDAAGRVIPLTAALENLIIGREILPLATPVPGSGSDDFDRIMSAQGLRWTLFMRIKDLNIPYGAVAWFFAGEYKPSAEDLFFVQAAAVMLGKRISELNARRLAQTNAQLAAAINSMNAGVAITDVTGPDSRVIFINPGFTAVTGRTPEEMIGRPCRLLDGQDVGPDDLKRIREAIALARPVTLTIRKYRKDGAPFWSETHLSFIVNAARKVEFVISVQTDVTARIEAEERMRQTMKMEALGQLTGGVAHDFNNILTVITGTIEILAEGVADRPKLQVIARMIGEAAERGGELTRRLLAFARKQPLQPRQTEINPLIADAVQLLLPSLGAQIEIEAVLEPGTWPALVDPSQLTTALVNLAVNARDAMPAGGKLTLETGNVVLGHSFAGDDAELVPGPYVMIAVSDTGTGIPAAIRDKVFEPFFTTKDERKGTGLGLSMVYGFVRQSGGHLKIYSEEGLGTSIKIYLPRADGPLEPDVPLAPAAPVHAGRETILVVEDDLLVRNYVIAQLRSLGYATVPAENAAEALDLVRRGTEFDLLFTDVIMPGQLDGVELAAEVARLRPGVKVLFTSGYTENAMIHQGRLNPGVLLLPKPYRRGDLAGMIRTALAGDDHVRTAGNGQPGNGRANGEVPGMRTDPGRA